MEREEIIRMSREVGTKMLGVRPESNEMIAGNERGIWFSLTREAVVGKRPTSLLVLTLIGSSLSAREKLVSEFTGVFGEPTLKENKEEEGCSSLMWNAEKVDERIRENQ